MQNFVAFSEYMNFIVKPHWNLKIHYIFRPKLELRLFNCTLQYQKATEGGQGSIELKILEKQKRKLACNLRK